MFDGDRPPYPKSDSASLAPVNWVGEVCDLLTDGRVTVRFPSGVKESFPLDRIYLLDDGLGHDGGMEPGDDVMDEDDALSAGSWETDPEDMPGGLDWHAHDQQDEEMSDAGWAEEDEEEAQENGLEVKEIILGEEEQGEEEQGEEEHGEEAKTAGVSMPAEVEDDENWKRFLMLEEAPAVH